MGQSSKANAAQQGASNLAPPTAPTVKQQPALQSMGPSSHQQSHPSSAMRAVSDLKKLIEDFLMKIECALHTPYDAAHAQKDYEAILATLTQLHRTLNEKDILFVGPSDKLDADKSEAAVQALFKKFVYQKSAVDSEFEKIAAATSAAKARVDEHS